MRSFLIVWFIVSVLITSLVSLVSTLWTGPSLVLATWEFYGSGLVDYESGLATTAIETGGVAALNALRSKINGPPPSQFFVFDSGLHEISGKPAPEFVRVLASRLQPAGRVQFQVLGRGLAAGKAVLLHDSRPLRVVFWFPSRQVPSFPQHPWAWFGRLTTILVSVGLLCSWLAWRLSAPLLRLNAAARRFASGDLAARAGAGSFPRRPPEYRELAHEFDEMAERIETLVTSQRNLLRDISHELRTPLTRLGLAVNNARGVQPEKLGALLDRIDFEADRLNVLIDRIVRLSRLESLALAPAHEPIEFGDFLESIVSDADFEADAYNRKVCITMAETWYMNGDRELLRDAVENVVRNAIRYTCEGGSVWVTAGRSGETGYRVTVRDEGPGVPPEQLKNIFDPFFRGRQTGAASPTGFGLGLAIAQRAIHLHGGTIVARNAASGGLEQIIELPGSDPFEYPKGGKGIEPEITRGSRLR